MTRPIRLMVLNEQHIVLHCVIPHTINGLPNIVSSTLQLNIIGEIEGEAELASRSVRKSNFFAAAV